MSSPAVRGCSGCGRPAPAAAILLVAILGFLVGMVIVSQNIYANDDGESGGVRDAEGDRRAPVVHPEGRAHAGARLRDRGLDRWASSRCCRSLVRFGRPFLDATCRGGCRSA